MVAHALIIGLLGVLSFGLPDPQRQFAGLTLASLLALALMPLGLKHHVRKIDTYHHEMAHGLVSILSGGRFHRFYVHPNGSGVSVTSGGKRKLIVSAGYVGSVLFGAVYLAHSARSESMDVTLYIMAGLYALSAIKAGDWETVSMGVAMSLIIGSVTFLMPGSISTRAMLNLIGVILICEGIRSLWILHVLAATTEGTGSDAEVMSRISGGHPIHWAFVFSAAAVLILFGLAGVLTNVQ